MNFRPFSIFPILLTGIAVCLSGCDTLQGPQGQPRTIAPASPPPVADSPPGAGAIWPEDAPQILATSAILIDARTGRVLYQKNADETRQVASTQKLISGMLLTRRGGLDGLVTIAPSDTRVEPTKLGLRAGERYPRRLLLQAMMVRSSNDATAALARDHSGSEEQFVAAMNQLAWQLGARNSRFANAHGLPAAQFSTARDVARFSYFAYRDPELRRMMLIQSMVFPFNSGRTTTLRTTNKLLERSPAFTGMKTGFTFAAGRCLVTSAQVNGRELILVQLNSNTRNIFNDAEKMISWAAQRPAWIL